MSAVSGIKAVIFDIDGTAIPNRRHAAPSERVTEAVKNAQENHIKLSCATGRNYKLAKRIIDGLSLNDPCIVSAGTQIIDPHDGYELWSLPLSFKSCRFALSVLAPYKLKVIVDNESYEESSTADKIAPKDYKMLDVQHVPKSHLTEIMEKLSADSSITSIPVHSSDPDLFFLHITNRRATKEHAVHELIRILGLDNASVAGVGDGLNDLELFKSVGYKVAMGNAINELKSAADLVVESVDDNGLANFLEMLQ